MCALVKLDSSMEEEYKSYLQEWKRNGEKIVPFSSCSGELTFSEYLAYLAQSETEEGCPLGFVPAVTWFYVDETGRILGAINFRTRLNDFLLQSGGHIGYGIRPSERRKGYAEKMLSLALKEVKKAGVSRVLITCDKENFGSAKTILKSNGILENEIIADNQTIQRYWITCE